jgi:FdhE protein
MTDDFLGNHQLHRAIEQLRCDRPYLETLLNAYGPLILEKHRWISENLSDPPSLPIDPDSYAKGTPVNRQYDLFVGGEPWESAVWSVSTSISQGFPHFSADMAKIVHRSRQVNDDFFQIFFSENGKSEELFQATVKDFGVDPVALNLFLLFLGRFMLEKKARDLAPALAAHTWGKGYCPVCGSSPHLATIGEHGQRRLHCADCSHSWQFPRLACPSCNHEDPENSSVFFIDRQEDGSAFTCDRCRQYVLTVNHTASLGEVHADLVTIGLAHLNLILQEKGYTPLVPCEWNTLGEYGINRTAQLSAAQQTGSPFPAAQ